MERKPTKNHETREKEAPDDRKRDLNQVSDSAGEKKRREIPQKATLFNSPCLPAVAILKQQRTKEKQEVDFFHLVDAVTLREITKGCWRPKWQIRWRGDFYFLALFPQISISFRQEACLMCLNTLESLTNAFLALFSPTISHFIPLAPDRGQRRSFSFDKKKIALISSRQPGGDGARFIKIVTKEEEKKETEGEPTK